MFFLFFAIYLFLILLLIFSVFCLAKSFVNENNYPHFVCPVDNKPEDDLPPYSPPTPRTRAAMADLPPSYEKMNNGSINVPRINASHLKTIGNNVNNIPTTTANNYNFMDNKVINLLSTHDGPNVNSLPEIIVHPLNTYNLT